MIGYLVKNGRTIAAMEDNGDWDTDDNSILNDYLTLMFHPIKARKPGDAASPFGVLALYRAAKPLNATVTLVTPVPDVPAGVTN